MNMRAFSTDLAEIDRLCRRAHFSPREEEEMSTPKEFSLAQLVEEAAVGFAMDGVGLDRRSLELLLGPASRSPQREDRLPRAPFVS
jgi:hypothetical protein